MHAPNSAYWFVHQLCWAWLRANPRTASANCSEKKKKSVTQTILRWHSKFPFARFLRKGVVITMNAEANVVV